MQRCGRVLSMHDLSELLDQRLRMLRILWLAFLATPGVLGGVLLTAMPGTAEGDPLVALALGSVGIALVPGVFVLRFLMMGPSLGLIVPRDLRAGDGVDDDELTGAVRSAAARYQTGSVVGFAMAEAVVIMGFVATWTSGDLRWFLGGAVAYGLLHLVQLPRRAGVLALLEPAEVKAARRALEG